MIQNIRTTRVMIGLQSYFLFKDEMDIEKLYLLLRLRDVADNTTDTL